MWDILRCHPKLLQSCLKLDMFACLKLWSRPYTSLRLSRFCSHLRKVSCMFQTLLQQSLQHIPLLFGRLYWLPQMPEPFR